MSTLDFPTTEGFGEDRQGALRYLDALREHWLLIGLIVALAVGGAAAYSLTAAKRYEAQADILVTPIAASDDTFIGVSVLRDTGAQQSAVVTAARLVKTPQVADAVRRKTGSSRSRDSLLASVTVTPLSQSNIVSIQAQSGTASGAATLANAFANEMITQRTAKFQSDLSGAIDRLEARISAIPTSLRTSVQAVAIEQRLSVLQALSGAGDPTLQVSSAAVSPEGPSWPRPVLSIVIALVASLLLAAGIAVGLEVLNPRIKREEELLFGQRLPILTRVPRMRQQVVRKYLAGRGPLPADVREAYRTLRASLATAGPDERFPQTILVTSAIPGEGKTMTSVNLAVTLALAGINVVLVDGDLRRPMVATVFGVTARRQGFASLLLGEISPEQALVSAPGQRDRLKLLLASPEHAHLVDLLDPTRVEDALAGLKLQADVVIVDSPPVTAVADALNLADAVDTVIVAVRLGRSRRDKLNELRRALSQRGVAPAGFVVTTRSASGRHGYYYGTAEAEKMPAPAAAQRRESAEPSVLRTDGEQDRRLNA